MRDLAALPDFRFVLRDATRADHDRLDARVTELDIATRQGFARFARLHLVCFTALDAAAPSDALRPMIAALRADLHMVDPAAAAATAPAHLAPVDPLAGAYMVEGSRMGTRVLQTRWAASQDPSVQAADRYFSLPPHPGAWQAVRAELSTVPAGTPRAARIEADVARIFALFVRVLDGL